MKTTVLLSLGIALLTAPLRAEVPIDYHTDIAPLLRDYCAGCHNGGDYEGGLSVETFAELMEGGESDDKAILVPGKPNESYLLQTILHTAKPVMPPKKEPQPTPAEVALLTRWITEGAKGPAEDSDISILSTLTVPRIEPSGKGAEAITAAAFSPDGKSEAIARFGRIELREAGSDKVTTTLALAGMKINAIHFSSDGTRLVAASGITGLKGEATIWDLKTGEILTALGADEHRDILFDAEFSPDGTLLATAGYDQIIHLWEIDSGELLRSFPSHNGAIYDLAFSSDGAVLASASGDGTCKIWQVATGERLDTLNQPEAEQYRIAFTPDGKSIIAAGADNRIRLWTFLSRTAPMINPLVAARFGHEDAIIELAVSPDGARLVTTSADRALKVWALPGLDLLVGLEAQSDVVSALAFAPGGASLLATRLDGSFGRYPMESGKKSAPAAGTTASVAPVASARAVSASLPGAGPARFSEVEGGESPALVLPSEMKGSIGVAGDTDDFRFSAKKGEQWVFEVNAARSKSKLDSRLVILDADRKPVEQVVLQAVRDSWLTFRGKDSKTSSDFRVHNWEEMELNEYLFVNGEVVKLHLYPRGPDSGFNVYPGFGDRRTFFQTTALAHPMGQPCYIVRAYPPGSEPADNGLPLHRLHYENDDDPERRFGADSVLRFTAPADGDYFVRIGDVRGFGGEGHDYTLIARSLQPDFSVTLDTKDLKIAPGSGKELLFTAKRSDGFDGPIDLEIAGLPGTLSLPARITIEPGQDRAYAMLRASDGFTGLPEADAAKVTITARGRNGEEEVDRKVGALTPVEALADKKVRVALKPDGDSGRVAEDGVLEFTIRPGETITALITVERNGFAGEVPFGKEDAGRNLPHGVYVDNIGLNGLMIQEGQNEQRLFITAAGIVPGMTREFHFVTTVDGGHGTRTARLRVVRGDQVAGK
ncbi:MAG: hypothetical protein NWT04_05340 [Verrucomicrobiales bacterium]|nr:hypothetical protein [Verrucomicrobiales bacterium]